MKRQDTKQARLIAKGYPYFRNAWVFNEVFKEASALLETARDIVATVKVAKNAQKHPVTPVNETWKAPPRDGLNSTLTHQRLLKLEGELDKFSKVLLTAALSGCYCYAVSKSTGKGFLRLLFLLPVAAFFAAAPYSLLKYHHLSLTIWGCLTWLGISKLLLLALGTGPLAAPDQSLLQFVCTLLLPIKIQSRPGSDRVKAPMSFWRWVLLGIKVVSFGCVIEAYNYRQGMPFWAQLGLYCCHLYLALEIFLVIIEALARGALGLELAPQANEPYLSSSLQDFWGRRWNLMISDVLRQTIYKPIRVFAAPYIGKKSAILIGVFTSFIVSSIMHEWMFAIMNCAPPSWEVTWFFILHGTCSVIELMAKMVIGNKWRMHRAISGPLTLGFVAVTAAWLYFPPILRNNTHEKVVKEYAIFGRYLKNNVLYLFRSN